MSADFRRNPADILAEILADVPDVSPELLGEMAMDCDRPVCSKCGADWIDDHACGKMTPRT